MALDQRPGLPVVARRRQKEALERRAALGRRARRTLTGAWLLALAAWAAALLILWLRWTGCP